MNSKKTNPSLPLKRLEEALVDSILNMSESELDAEMREMNLDPKDVAARTKAAVDRGVISANKASLVHARTQLAGAKSSLSVSAASRDRAGALARFEKMKVGDTELPSSMMMAARKGQGLSEEDIEGVLEDLDDLEKLEKGDDQG